MANHPNRNITGIQKKRERANSLKYMNNLAMIASEIMLKIREKTKVGESLNGDDRRDLELCLAIIKTSMEIKTKRRQMEIDCSSKKLNTDMDNSVSVADLKSILQRVG